VKTRRPLKKIGAGLAEPETGRAPSNVSKTPAQRLCFRCGSPAHVEAG